MSDELIRTLREQLDKANGEAKKFRLQMRKYKEELGQVSNNIQTLTKERDDLAKKIESSPNELQTEVDRLNGVIRTRSHKDAWQSIAKELKLRPEAIDDVYALSGYQADTDEADQEVIKTAIGKVIESRPYLVVSEEKEAPAPVKLQPTPGLSRGQEVQVDGMVVRKADMNHSFMEANAKKMAEYSRAGKLQIID